MQNQDIMSSHIRATLTTDDAMKLIQHLASYGVEAAHLDVRVTRYGNDDMSVHISVNGGMGVILDGIAAVAKVDEAVTA